MAKKSAGGGRKKAKPVRVAMIGAGGRAAAVHYPSLRDIPDAEIVAVCELNEERLAKAAETFGIKGRYSDHKEMIEKEKPDAVYVIMPPHIMYDVCADVIERDCHLFIEKPPAVNAEQSRQLALLAERHKVLTGVTFQRRFAPVIRKGKAICEKAGPVHSAVSTFYKHSSGSKPYYRGAMDILTCDAIHAVDTLRYLCGGEVVSVASDVRRLDSDVINIHMALITFSTGATGVLLTNWMTGRRLFSVEIHSPGVSVFGDPEEGGNVYADNKAEPVQALDPYALSKSKDDHVAFGTYDNNLHFIQCIQKGKQPETNFSDAAKTMELVDEIYHSQI